MERSLSRMGILKSPAMPYQLHVHRGRQPEEKRTSRSPSVILQQKKTHKQLTGKGTRPKSETQTGTATRREREEKKHPPNPTREKFPGTRSKHTTQQHRHHQQPKMCSLRNVSPLSFRRLLDPKGPKKTHKHKNREIDKADERVPEQRHDHLQNLPRLEPNDRRHL